MAEYRQDCIYNDMPSEFLAFTKIHVLGSFMKQGIHADINPLNNLVYAEIHEIYDSAVFNVDAMVDHNDSWWEDLSPNQLYKNSWSDVSVVYDVYATYTAGNQTLTHVRNALKGNVQIDERFYVLRESCTGDGAVNSPFSAGALKAKSNNSYSWEPVLICQGSEKSYYTLETRMYTLWNYSQNTSYPFNILNSFLSSHVSGSPSNCYESELQAEAYYMQQYGSYYIINKETEFGLFTWQGEENTEHALDRSGGAPAYPAQFTENGRTKIPMSRYVKSYSDLGPVWRYIGGLLSNCNMYESQLAVVNHTNWQGMVQVPIHGKVQGSGEPWNASQTLDKPRRSQYMIAGQKTGISSWSGNEGYLNDRDVILVSNGDLYNTENTDIREVEFELFYCTNVNDPTATMNLVNFANQLTIITSNFNTKIPTSSQINSFVTSTTANKVTPIINYRLFNVYYGSKVSFTTIIDNYSSPTTGDTNIINMPGYTNSNVQVIPFVIFSNIYVWLQGKSPVLKPSYTLTGSKVTGTTEYTYGEYFVGYYDRALFLIDKITYNKYMYNPAQFVEEVTNILNENDLTNIGPYNASTNRFGWSDTDTVNHLS